MIEIAVNLFDYNWKKIRMTIGELAIDMSDKYHISKADTYRTYIDCMEYLIYKKHLPMKESDIIKEMTTRFLLPIDMYKKQTK